MTDQDDLRELEARRMQVPPSPPYSQNVTVNVTNQRKRVSHGFHLFMTIITLGLWLPVWIIVAIAA